MSPDASIHAFFYGLFMDPEFLATLNVHPSELRLAKAPGYRLDLRGKAKMLPEAQGEVWGTLLTLPAKDLVQIYSLESTSAYQPGSVEVITDGGESLNAACYNLPEDQTSPFNSAYLTELLPRAERLGLPQEYLSALSQQS